MLDPSKKIGDEILDNVAGGVTLTPNDDGSVTMIDKNNKEQTFTKEQWAKLKDYWSYTNNPVPYIMSVPIDDLNSILTR